MRRAPIIPSAITEVLRINESTARYKRLESVLGTKLQFEPRRRARYRVHFCARAGRRPSDCCGRSCAFHYAGDIPTYATSDAFEPDTRANQDLDGLMFPDMPWMLGGDLADAVRAAARDAWPNGGLYARAPVRLRFRRLSARPGAAASRRDRHVNIDGLTGRLSLDADRRVRRELGWAQVHNGELRPLAPAAPRRPRS